MEINEVMLFIIGIAATVIVWGIKLYRTRSGGEVSTVFLQWLVYVVSLGLALAFQLPVLPAVSFVGGPIEIVGAAFEWVGALIAPIAPAFTFATLLYSTLLKLVMDKLEAKFR